jgi:hypothetical protein
MYVKFHYDANSPSSFSKKNIFLPICKNDAAYCNASVVVNLDVVGLAPGAHPEILKGRWLAVSQKKSVKINKRNKVIHHPNSLSSSRSPAAEKDKRWVADKVPG